MNTGRFCPKCKQPVPADAAEGLCPACLLLSAASSLSTPPPPGPQSYAESKDTETKQILPGTRLGYVGDYELLEEIARGGMGVVYRARQSSLKRIVAVKMIRSGELAGEVEVKRFHAEAEAAAQLKHPNIVAIHEIGEHQGRHYFSMDFVAGKNLAQTTAASPVTARQAAHWIQTIAETVQFAHQRGVLHRDLKPQNILLDAEGKPHVTDFGLAKNLHADTRVTQTGAVMGSPSYMAPEQARGRNDLVGPASDVYSLGAVLYELLTGRAPFRGESPIETLHRVIHDEPPRPRSLNPDTPADLETICLKCLEKDPARRYPTARALAEDAGRFLAGEPVQARPANAYRRAMNWGRRHQSLVNAVASVASLALVGITYGLWEQTRYLTWLNSHPDYIRTEVGPRSMRLNAQAVWGFWSVTWVVMLTWVYQKLSTRTPWKQMWNFRALFEPPQPLGAGWIGFFVTCGTLSVVNALYFATRAIAAYVWEGYRPLAILYVLCCPCLYFGLGLVIKVLREQAAEPLGLPPLPGAPSLTPEQLASFSAALFKGQKRKAIQYYLEVTGLSHRQARRQLGALILKLYEEQPEKFPGHPVQFNKVLKGYLVIGLAALLVALLTGCWLLFFS